MSTVEAGRNANDKRPIYFDYQATTPCDPRVLEAMIPWFTEKFGNPHSRNPRLWAGKPRTRSRRRANRWPPSSAPMRRKSSSPPARPSRTTSPSRAWPRFNKDRKDHIITVNTEHKCVLDTCRHLEQEGFKVTYLPVRANGLIDLKLLEQSITDRTSIVSVMAANNEIGVIQPIAEIGALCRAKGVYFHTDGAQAVGKIPLDVNAMNIDLMSISGHKLYGPKGIGALYVRRRPRVRLEALIHGGGQERGMRSGTLSTPLVVGIGEACRIAKEEMNDERARLTALRDRMWTKIQKKLPEVYLNGDLEQRLPGQPQCLFRVRRRRGADDGREGHRRVVGFGLHLGVAGNPLMCCARWGVDAEMAHTSLRLGLGRFTTEAEVDFAVDHIADAVTRLRELSPLWEMHQEGIDIKSIQWAEH